MDFEHIGLMIDRCKEGTVERREILASDVYDRAVDFGNCPNQCFIVRSI